jgi:putative aldouronate transport system permease protein
VREEHFSAEGGQFSFRGLTSMRVTIHNDLMDSETPLSIHRRIIPERKSFFQRLNKSKYLLILALPTFLYMVIFRYIPMYGLIISFYDYDLYKGIRDSQFVGFYHFIKFFRSVDFFLVVKNTFLLGLYRLVWAFPVPIILALVINEVRSPFIKRVVQTVSYLPYFVSVVVVASMTIMILSPSGIVNQLIMSMGGKPVYFMSHPEYYRTIFVLTHIWQSSGWISIIYLAAISAVDPQLYEAAVIDGANKLRQIFNITIPCIANTIVVVLLLNIGSIVAVEFDKSFMLQNALNMNTADVISTFVYRMGIQSMNYSYATAVGSLNSVISFAFVYFGNYVSRKFGEHSLF